MVNHVTGQLRTQINSRRTPPPKSPLQPTPLAAGLLSSPHVSVAHRRLQLVAIQQQRLQAPAPSPSPSPPVSSPNELVSMLIEREAAMLAKSQKSYALLDDDVEKIKEAEEAGRVRRRTSEEDDDGADSSYLTTVD